MNGVFVSVLLMMSVLGKPSGPNIFVEQTGDFKPSFNGFVSNQNEENARFDFGESCLTEQALFRFKLLGNFDAEMTPAFEGNISVESWQKASDTEIAFSVTLPQHDGWLRIFDCGRTTQNVFLYSSRDANGLFHVSSLSDYAAAYDAGNVPGQAIHDHGLDRGSQSGNIQNDGLSGSRDIVSGRVYGFLKFKDQQGNMHPLIGAKVKLTFTGS